MEKGLMTKLEEACLKMIPYCDILIEHKAEMPISTLSFGLMIRLMNMSNRIL